MGKNTDQSALLVLAVLALCLHNLPPLWDVGSNPGWWFRSFIQVSPLLQVMQQEMLRRRLTGLLGSLKLWDHAEDGGQNCFLALPDNGSSVASDQGLYTRFAQDQL